MKIEQYIAHLCGAAEKVNSTGVDFDIQIIDAVGEVEINGTEYQIQFILEPRDRKWVPNGSVTVRRVDENEVLSLHDNKDISYAIIDGFVDDMQFDRYFEGLIDEIHSLGHGVKITQEQYFAEFNNGTEAMKDLGVSSSDIFDEIPESRLNYLHRLRLLIERMIGLETESCEGEEPARN